MGKGDQGGARGRALTPQRQAVLRVVSESAEHLTANEIFESRRPAFLGDPPAPKVKIGRDQ